MDQETSIKDIFTFDRERHIYRLNGRILPSVTQVLQGMGIPSFDGVPATDLERACKRGSAVHLATQYLDEGRLDWSSIPDELMGYLVAYEKFREDKRYRFGIIDIEKPLYDPSFLFAGTPDRVIQFSDRRGVLEIKTSVESLKFASLQTGGYSIILGPEETARVAVHLRPDGTYNPVHFTESTDGQIFLSCLAVYNWKQNQMGGSNGNQSRST